MYPSFYIFEKLSFKNKKCCASVFHHNTFFFFFLPGLNSHFSCEEKAVAVTNEHQKKVDLSDFDQSMTAPAIFVGSEHFRNCRSPTRPSPEFTENGPKMRKYPVSETYLVESALLSP